MHICRVAKLWHHKNVIRQLQWRPWSNVNYVGVVPEQHQQGDITVCISVHLCLCIWKVNNDITTASQKWESLGKGRNQTVVTQCMSCSYFSCCHQETIKKMITWNSAEPQVSQIKAQRTFIIEHICKYKVPDCPIIQKYQYRFLP